MNYTKLVFSVPEFMHILVSIQDTWEQHKIKFLVIGDYFKMVGNPGKKDKLEQIAWNNNLEEIT